MANEYATVDDLKIYLGIEDSDDDPALVFAVEDAARSIDIYCGRRFYLDDTATARVYEPADAYCLAVDDIGDVTGLLVKADYSGGGTFDTTFSASQYELGPLSGGSEGIEGYPYTEVRLLSQIWPRLVPQLRRGRAQVTAKWGWAAVPRPVFRANLVVAAEMFRRKDAPFGVSGGADFGQIRLGNDSMRQVQSLLDPYRSGRRIGAMA